ncbi:MAG TPA: hypothetical protein VJ819_13165 [Nocardioidaceae bacterium]|nr:hypothetical protein [Nocardioidaceae bacterium]
MTIAIGWVSSGAASAVLDEDDVGGADSGGAEDAGGEGAGSVLALQAVTARASAPAAR